MSVYTSLRPCFKVLCGRVCAVMDFTNGNQAANKQTGEQTGMDEGRLKVDLSMKRVNKEAPLLL